jgi:hypothetical protein
MITKWLILYSATNAQSHLQGTQSAQATSRSRYMIATKRPSCFSAAVQVTSEHGQHAGYTSRSQYMIATKWSSCFSAAAYSRLRRKARHYAGSPNEPNSWLSIPERRPVSCDSSSAASTRHILFWGDTTSADVVTRISSLPDRSCHASMGVRTATHVVFTYVEFSSMDAKCRQGDSDVMRKRAAR